MPEGLPPRCARTPTNVANSLFFTSTSTVLIQRGGSQLGPTREAAVDPPDHAAVFFWDTSDAIWRIESRCSTPAS
jgi:hypothetical protein